MPSLKALVFAVLVAASPITGAGDAAPAAADPALEKRMMKIADILRCLVCQNQTIADSHAELAIDLKNQIREKLAAGMTDQQIIDFMVQRYGDFVLYNPPVRSSTWLLWFGPFVLLVGGVGALFIKLRKRAARPPAPVLSESEHQRAMQLLAAEDRRDRS